MILTQSDGFWEDNFFYSFYFLSQKYDLQLIGENPNIKARSDMRSRFIDSNIDVIYNLAQTN